jgi:hypothetical protein
MTRARALIKPIGTGGNFPAATAFMIEFPITLIRTAGAACESAPAVLTQAKDVTHGAGYRLSYRNHYHASPYPTDADPLWLRCRRSRRRNDSPLGRMAPFRDVSSPGSGSLAHAGDGRAQDERPGSSE